MEYDRGIEEASWRFMPQDIGERGEGRDIINGTSSRATCYHPSS
jgi:hypothetical protein